jgi:TonB family protein
MIKIPVLFLLLIGSAVSAAAEDLDGYTPVRRMTHCESPVRSRSDNANRAWFSTNSYKLSFCLTQEDHKTIFAKGAVRYSFQLLPDGTIKDIRMEETSGSKQVEERALEVIKQAVPYTKSMNPEPYERRVNVIFSDHVTIKLGDKLSRLNK